MAEHYYILSLRPMLPYFFGGERNLAYGDVGQQAAVNPYYIESEKLPPQSTLFGVTRFLGIEEKTEDFKINESIIGKESFSFEKKNQSFGKIKGISGLYLEKTMDSGENAYYIKTPLDHDIEKEEYTPMTYTKKIAATCGNLLVPKEYKVKKGTTRSYMNVKDGKIEKENEIFLESVQVKIHKTKKEDGFLKKKYWTLKPGYRFAFTVCVEEGFPEIKKQVVFMGKEKSPFLLSVKEGTININQALFKKTVMLDEKEQEDYVRKIALSDCYVAENTDFSQICDMMYLSFKSHREFMTNYSNDCSLSHLRRYKKQNYLVRLVKAGSVFIVKKENIEDFNRIIKNTHVQIAGYNQINGGEIE